MTPDAERLSTKEGDVLVFRGLNKLLDFTTNNPLKTIVEKLGMDIQQFGKIMVKKYDRWDGDTINISYPPDKPVEDLVIKSTKSIYGLAIEAVEVTAYAIHTMKTLLSAPKEDGKLRAIDFEAIFVESGDITYRILDGYQAHGHVYWSDSKGQDVTLKQGDLLILKRGVARQIVNLQHGTKYMYISAPWDEGRYDARPIDILEVIRHN